MDAETHQKHHANTKFDKKFTKNDMRACVRHFFFVTLRRILSNRVF